METSLNITPAEFQARALSKRWKQTHNNEAATQA